MSKKRSAILATSVSVLALGFSAAALASNVNGENSFHHTTTGWTQTVSINPGQTDNGGALTTVSGSNPNATASVTGGTAASSYIGASHLIGAYRERVFITPGTGTGDANVNILVPGAPSALAATIGVHATANAHKNNSAGGTSAFASATAAINTGVYQLGVTNRGSVAIDLTNHGNINIDVNAHANNGTSTSSFGGHGASANATLGNGIVQTGSAPVSDTLTLTNTGNINIHANAYANAYDVSAARSSGFAINATASAYAGASAQAHIGNGILQDASSSPVDTAGLTNSGTINIYSYANATASSAYAYGHVFENNFGQASAYSGAAARATLQDGIKQNASGNTSATVSLTNSVGGYIGIGATASANAYSDAAAHALASGSHANATAYSGAVAYAGITDGISQTATSAAPSVTLTNSGTIEINVTANAHSNNGHSVATASAYDFNGQARGFAGAYATATIDNGIYQSAVGNISAPSDAVSDTLTNSHTIRITASASGVAYSEYANAHAHPINLLGSQNVYANATAGAVVKANIGGGGTSATQHGAGIEQSASGNTPSVTLTNSGAITIKAFATAYAHGYDTALSYANNHAGGSGYSKSYAGAYAYATADIGIQQNATTPAKVLASAQLTNNKNDTITIAATAYANQTAGNLLHPGASAFKPSSKPRQPNC